MRIEQTQNPPEKLLIYFMGIRADLYMVHCVWGTFGSQVDKLI